jgi:hypothetical protein
MIRLLNPVPVVNIPDWARTLVSHYWRIRVESRDKAKRRRYYRYVEKEKLRLAELGIDQELIRATCRHLSSYSIVSGLRLQQLLDSPTGQMSLKLCKIDTNNRAV